MIIRQILRFFYIFITKTYKKEYIYINSNVFTEKTIFESLLSFYYLFIIIQYKKMFINTLIYNYSL